jgi:hypothetical protein
MLRKAGKGRLVAAVLAVLLALPLSAAEAAGHGARGSDLWSGFVAWLTTGSITSLWAEDGLAIDPFGRTTAQSDDGSQIDPFGRTTAQSDEGRMIDPDGR